MTDASATIGKEFTHQKEKNASKIPANITHMKWLFKAWKACDQTPLEKLKIHNMKMSSIDNGFSEFDVMDFTSIHAFASHFS